MTGRPPEEDELDRLRDEVEEAGIPWLDRIARAGLSVSTSPSPDDIDHLGDACQREGDRWGEALVALMCGTGQLWCGAASARYLERAAQIFDDLGAGVLQSAACGYLALAAHAAGDPRLATRSAHQARTLASLLDVPGAAGVAALALARLLDDARELARARELLEPLGTWHWHAQLGAAAGPPAAAGDRPRPLTGENAQVDGAWRVPSVRLRCLGGFSLMIHDRVVDESVAKPMERALLHLLAMRAGEQVHREALIEALWPEAQPDAGLHRLQVAVSALRRLLSPGQQNGQQPLLTREGDSYRLALPEDSDVDLWQVEANLRRAVTARQVGELDPEEDALAAALSAYGGPLLPGDGPANWVVGRRSSLQVGAVDAATRLASLRLQRGDPQGAAEVARIGVSLDRYRDELWKLLIEAAERSGHHAEAGQARRAYAAVLEELGV
jgi:DNA-binding SARP family transcriptional activator